MARSTITLFFLTRWFATALLLGLTAPAVLASPAATTYALGEINHKPGGGATSLPTLSGDGRYVAYINFTYTQQGNAFVYDRVSGTNVQADLTSAGLPSTGGNTSSPVVSADGHYVVFRSLAHDMGLTGTEGGIFLYDRINNITKPIYKGNPIGNPYRSLGISSDGHYVVYRALTAFGSTTSIIYVYDTVQNTTQAVDTTHALTAPFVALYISDDGRYVGYMGRVAVPSPGPVNLLLHDRVTGATELLNVNSAGQRENQRDGTQSFSMSANGKAISFVSTSSNLVPGDTGTNRDIFVRDRVAGTTERLSASYSGDSGVTGTSISSDGRFVTFLGVIPSIYSSETLYRYDRLSRTAKRGYAAPGFAINIFSYPVISGDGRYGIFNGAIGTSNQMCVTDFGIGTGVAVAPATVALTEGGDSATYSAVLLQQPAANVTLNVAPDAQLSVARSQLTFTPSNWSTPQIVSVQAPANEVFQGPHTGIVKHTAVSTDPEYTGLPVASVTATITDGVVPTIVVPTLWSPMPIPVSGTAAPGATVLVTVSTEGAPAFLSVSAVADAQGHWSSTLFVPSPGAWELEAVSNGIHSIVYTMNLAVEAQ
ncbi:hypothetical protein LJR289_000189 [Pseudoduganella sp. LjRoot289]|uniref:hypothetical protein n=1 Tax=Pseudoduganella sp. LjRoot289 TaxID=3342314 RepID=UPI003ECDC75E